MPENSPQGSVASLFVVHLVGTALVATIVMLILWLSLTTAIETVSTLTQANLRNTRIHALYRLALQRQHAVARLYAAGGTDAARAAYAAEREDMDKRQDRILAGMAQSPVRSGIEGQQKIYCDALDALADAYSPENASAAPGAAPVLMDAPEWKEYDTYMRRVFFAPVRAMEGMEEPAGETHTAAFTLTLKALCIPLAAMLLFTVVSIWSVRKRLRAVHAIVTGEQNRWRAVVDSGGAASQESAEEAVRNLEGAAEELDSLGRWTIGKPFS